MNDALDAAVLLPPDTEKPSKQYRTSSYTVRQYMALPYVQRRAVDTECDQQAGLSYTTYDDETSEKPFTVGRRTMPAHSSLSPTLSTPNPMTAYVHPAPSPALHHLNSPELIEHDAAHPDNEHTSAVPVVPSRLYDIVAVAGHYVNLTAAEHDGWTHWGYSPFLGGDTRSFAVNATKGFYKCFISGHAGGVMELVMFLEECSYPEALAWLAGNFPASDATPEVQDTAEEVSSAPDFTAPLEESAQPTAGSTALASLAAQVTEVCPSPIPTPSVPAEEIPSGAVEHTTKYHLFSLLDSNRPVVETHVQKLARQIQENNLLHIRPIDVTAEFEVVDGQHRLAAAKQLGLPIYYRITEQLTKADIASLNTGSKNWVGTDYLHYWAQEGRPAYQKLAAFLAKYRRFSLTTGQMLVAGSDACKADDFRDGLFVVGNIAKGEQVAAFVERLADEAKFKYAFDTRFVVAVYYCMVRIEGFDSAVFLRKVLLQPTELVRCATHRQYLDLFERLYNYKTSQENRLRFR